MGSGVGHCKWDISVTVAPTWPRLATLDSKFTSLDENKNFEQSRYHCLVRLLNLWAQKHSLSVVANRFSCAEHQSWHLPCSLPTSATFQLSVCTRLALCEKTHGTKFATRRWDNILRDITLEAVSTSDHLVNGVWANNYLLCGQIQSRLTQDTMSSHVVMFLRL